MFDQHENFQSAISRMKAQIEEIQLILTRPMPQGVIRGSIRRLIEKRLHLEQAVAETQAEDIRLHAREEANRPADHPFRWEDLDQRLLSLKLQELAEEMQKRVAEGERKAAFDTQKSGNSAGYLPRLFEVQQELTDEWAKGLYDVHCEVWRIQGHSISTDFIRAVSSRAIPELIAARKGAVAFGAQLWCTRTGQPPNTVALGEWSRAMDSLVARWARKLEAEAVASEYRAPRLISRPTEEQAAADLLSLPAGLKSSGDPIDQNPFPVDDPRLIPSWFPSSPRAIGLDCLAKGSVNV